MRKAKQRGNGEGTIVTIKRGKRVRYAAEITTRWEDGKRIKKRGELRATKAEAFDDLERMKREHARDIDLSNKQTVREFVKSYITDVIVPYNKPRTVDAYRWGETHINKAFGDTALRKLSGQAIQRFITKLSNTLKPRSVQLIYTVLNGALKKAKQYKLITDNPAEGIELPSMVKHKAPFLTPEQARTFLAAAKGERLEVGLRIMLSLGLRRGEVSGIRWEDIDFERGVLTINGSIGYVKGRGLVYDTPKSDSGVRRIKVPASILSALQQHRVRQQAERRAMGDKWPQDVPYVFIGVKNGTMLNPDRFYSTVKAVAKRADLSSALSPHSLRHSCASFLYAEGVPEKAISAFLGHANTTITRELYVHLLGGELDDAAEQVERLLDIQHDDIEENVL